MLNPAGQTWRKFCIFCFCERTKNKTNYSNFYNLFLIYIGARGGVVIKALRYKPTGRGFDSR